MRTNLRFFVAASMLVGILAFAGCTETEETLELSTKKLSFKAQDASLKPVVVAVNGDWTALPDQAWIKIMPGDGYFVVSAEENTDVGTRSGKIAVSAGDKKDEIVVNQEKASLFMKARPGKLVFSPIGSEPQDVTITSNGEGAWDAVPSASWIKVTKGTDKFTVNVDPNPTKDGKTGKIEVSVDGILMDVAVTQMGVSLSLNENSLVFNKEGNQAQQVAVNTNMTWNATSASDWIKLTKGNGTLSVDVTPNEGVDIKTGTITVKAGNITEDIAVRQNGVIYALSTTPSSLTFPGSDAPAQEVTVTTDAPSWSASTTDEWITITEDTGKFTVKVKDFFSTSLTERTGTVTVIVPGGTTKDVSVLQNAASMDEFFTGATWAASAYGYIAAANITWTSQVTKDADGVYLFSNFANQTALFMPFKAYKNSYIIDTKYFIVQNGANYYFPRWRYYVPSTDGWRWWGSGGDNDAHIPAIDIENGTITFPSTVIDGESCPMYVYAAGYDNKEDSSSSHSTNYRFGDYLQGLKYVRQSSSGTPQAVSSVPAVDTTGNVHPTEPAINVK